MTRTTKTTTRKLWSFNWQGGGYNSVIAPTRKAAIKQIAKEFGNCNLVADLSTLRHQKDVEAYHRSLPFWD